MNNSIQTSFTDWKGGLQHFGTKGMKWGTRRFQYADGSLTPEGARRYGNGQTNRSARGVSRDLRRLEKEHAGSKARADYYSNRVLKAKKKAELKAEKTGKPVKISDKVQRMTEKAKNYRDLAKKSRAMSDTIINNALKKGYSVKSRDTMRFVRKGKDKGLMLLGRRGTSVNSVKYHVKNNKLGLRTHRKSVGYINRHRHKSNFI